jgi:lysophospholipase L1-like esterase
MKKIITALIACVLGLTGYLAYIAHTLQQPPAQNPAWFMQNKAAYAGKKTVVCVGDSITHGSVCASYVKMLENSLPPRGYVVVNAGINSNLAWNVRQRLDAIIGCNPDIVTVLVGTNDANAMLHESNARRLIKKMSLPQHPDHDWFRDNLAKIIVRLKNETHAKIALLSLLPIGEDLDSPACDAATRYSRTIKEMATRQNVAYLPLNETLTGYLAGRNRAPKVSYTGDTTPLLHAALLKQYLLGVSYDRFSDANGFLLLIDMLHPNTRCAAMTAEMVGKFILAQQ